MKIKKSNLVIEIFHISLWNVRIYCVAILKIYPLFNSKYYIEMIPVIVRRAYYIYQTLMKYYCDINYQALVFFTVSVKYI